MPRPQFDAAALTATASAGMVWVVGPETPVTVKGVPLVVGARTAAWRMRVLEVSVEGGERGAVTPGGKPETARWTASEKPLLGVTVRVSARSWDWSR